MKKIPSKQFTEPLEPRRVMDTEKFRGMISNPKMTKLELKQVLANIHADHPELAEEVRAILTKRFPTWAKPAARRMPTRAASE